MVSLEKLDTLAAFSGFSDDQLKALQFYFNEFSFQRGDKLFTEGDSATDVWFVVDGDVDLRFELPGGRPTSEDNTISKISVKDQVAKTLGWSCFVPPRKMRLSAYCTSRTCQVVKIKIKHLLDLFEEDPKAGFLFMSYVVKVVGFRFHQFQDEVAKSRGQAMMMGW
jgi:CRP-like cAMP-binding protein